MTWKTENIGKEICKWRVKIFEPCIDPRGSGRTLSMFDKLDALEALHPGEFARIVIEHIEEYYDPSFKEEYADYVHETSVRAVPPTVRIEDPYYSVVLSPDQDESIQYEPSNEKQVQQKQVPEIEIRWFADKKGFNEKVKHQINKIPKIGEIFKTDVITICKEAMNELSDTVTKCENCY